MKRFKLQTASVILVVLALFVVAGYRVLSYFGVTDWAQAVILGLPGIGLFIAVGVSHVKNRHKAAKPADPVE